MITGALLLVVTFLILWLAPSNDYLLLPDRAHPVAPLVAVAGARPDDDGGGIYFLDVFERRATLLESIFPSIREGATLVPGSAINPPGVTEAVRQRADQREMARSQEIAAAVALRQLGYKVVAHRSGALVAAVLDGSPSEGKLAPTDVIVAVDGHPVRTTGELRQRIQARRPGAQVTLTVRAAGGLRTVRLRTVADPHEPSHAIIGILVEPAAQIKLPIKVSIDAGNIGGPSAGLAFALELMEKLGHDVDHGYRVAATGELGLDGSVIPIGAVRQKVFGARRSDIDILLVPAGANADVARRSAKGVRVVPVTSFRQALQALAKLPRKP